MHLAAASARVIASGWIDGKTDMDENLNLAELDDVDLYMLLTLLFPNASEDRVFRQIAEEVQRRGWTDAPDKAVIH